MTLRSLSTKAKVHSGLQRQVLTLYRTLLRASFNKERGTNITNENTFECKSFVTLLRDSNSTTYNVSTQFRKEAMSMSKRDIDFIEHGIRKGEKYVKLLKMGSVRGFQMA